MVPNSRVGSLQNNKCPKCNTNKSILMNRTNNWSEDDFQAVTVFKFQNYFNQKKILSFNGNLLFVYNANIASVAIMHFLNKIIQKSSMNQSNHKIYVLFLNNDVNSRKGETSSVYFSTFCDQVKKSGFEGYFTSLADCFVEEKVLFKSIDDSGSYQSQNAELFNRFLNKLGDNTAKDDLLTKLQSKLTSSIADKLKCSYVILDDSLADLASSILSNIVLGQGVCISHTSDVSNKKHSGTKFLYPLLHFKQEEVVNYLKLYKEYNNVLSNVTNSNENEKASIQKLSKTFVLKLESNSGSATSTIHKISEKMNNLDLQNQSSACCNICYKLLGNVNDSHKVSSQSAKNISQFMSRVGNLEKYVDKKLNDDEVENSAAKLSDDDVNICYSCIVLLQSFYYKYLNVF